MSVSFAPNVASTGTCPLCGANGDLYATPTDSAGQPGPRLCRMCLDCPVMFECLVDAGMVNVALIVVDDTGITTVYPDGATVN